MLQQSYSQSSSSSSTSSATQPPPPLHRTNHRIIVIIIRPKSFIDRLSIEQKYPQMRGPRDPIWWCDFFRRRDFPLAVISGSSSALLLKFEFLINLFKMLANKFKFNVGVWWWRPADSSPDSALAQKRKNSHRFISWRGVYSFIFIC